MSNISSHVRESKTVLDSGFHAMIPDSSYWISVEFLFWIPIVGGIPDSRTQDSGYNKKNFIGFDIPDSIQANLIFPGFRNQEFLTWGELLA